MAKKSKRCYALETIRTEFAKHGESTRAYIENRISHQAYLDAAQKGMRQYKGRPKPLYTMSPNTDTMYGVNPRRGITTHQNLIALPRGGVR